MPYADPEKYKEYQRNYQRNILWTDEEKKEKAKYQKEYMKNYVKPKYHNRDTIYNWKKRGLIETDGYTYQSIYEKYMSCVKCESCEVGLTIDKKRKSTTKCMDHCHQSGIFRDIICHSCNLKRG